MKNPLEDMNGEIQHFFSQHSGMNETNVHQLGELLERDRIRELLEFVVDDETALSEIAKRSYIHSQGFSKIIVIDDRAGSGFKHRLHLWPKKKAAEAGAPITEMKHEHRWDFTSRVLAGEMEDHWYSIRNLKPEEREIFEGSDALMTDIAKNNPLQLARIITRLDLFELLDKAYKKSHLLAMSGGIQRIQEEADKLTEFPADELPLIARTMIKNVNERNAEGREVYVPDGPRYFEPIGIHLHRAGELRLHPISAAHRLVIDPRRDVATTIITGPVYKGRRPGEFVRSNATKPKGEDIRERSYYTKESLRKDLEWLLRTLTANQETTRTYPPEQMPLT